jgi:hypothetical protein
MEPLALTVWLSTSAAAALAALVVCYLSRQRGSSPGTELVGCPRLLCSKRPVRAWLVPYTNLASFDLLSATASCPPNNSCRGADRKKS